MKYDNDFNEESGSDDSIDEQATVWFAQLQAENVTDQEKAEFARWLALDPAHRQAFDEIRMLWNDTSLKQILREAEAKSPASCQPKEKARPGLWLPLFLAACLIFLLIFCVGLARLFQADYATQAGEQKTVRLEDGSAATLNTDSGSHKPERAAPEGQSRTSFKTF